MIKKYIIVIIAVVLAVWLGFFFKQKAAVAPEAPVNGAEEQATTTAPVATTTVKKTTTTKISTPKVSSYAVYYTDRGFSPATIEVKVGSTITFINNSSKEMSIASAGIGGFGAVTLFNQTNAVGRGGTFKVSPAGVGAWNYMNRMWQGDKGTIVVK